MKALVFILIIALTGCAGYNTNEMISRGDLPEDANYILVPFKDPSLNGKIYSGVGGRFTQSFSKASSKMGYDLIQASSQQFPTSKDMDLEAAIIYAQGKGADYVIVGQVTKWIDRATEWNFKRDFAGLSVAAYDVFTKKLVKSIEIDQHSNNFYSGTPDDYVKSLSVKVADKLYRE